MLAAGGDAAGAAGVLAARGAPPGAPHVPLYRFVSERVLALGAGVDPAQASIMCIHTSPKGTVAVTSCCSITATAMPVLGACECILHKERFVRASLTLICVQI